MSEIPSKSIVIVDATKFFKLLWGNIKNRGTIYKAFQSLRKRNCILIATEENLRRAEESLIRKLSARVEKAQKLELPGEIKLLIEELTLTICTIANQEKRIFDKVIKESFYQDKLPVAINFMNDKDPEDAHALALAMKIKELYPGKTIVIWTDDTDFLLRAKEIEKLFNVKIRKIA